MSKTSIIDPEGVFEVVDEETNFNRGTYGAEDRDQSDKIRTTVNQAIRRALLQGRNEGEGGDIIPLFGTFIPDRAMCYHEGDDFNAFDADDDYVVTQATAGTADVIDGVGGILQLDSNSATADQGIQVQRKVETFKLAANTQLCFISRFKVTDLANNSQIFVGLGVLDTTFMAAGVVSASDYIGFFQDVNVIAGTGDYTPSTLAFGLYDGVTLEEVKSAAAMVEDTYLIAGFYVDGVTTATPFTVNDSTGVITLGTAITIADPPDTEMAFTAVCQSEGTVDPILSMDWYDCWQTR